MTHSKFTPNDKITVKLKQKNLTRAVTLEKLLDFIKLIHTVKVKIFVLFIIFILFSFNPAVSFQVTDQKMNAQVTQTGLSCRNSK